MVGGGVAVDDPEHLAVDDRRVDVAVEGQPGRDLLDPLHRVAVVEHPAVGADPAGEQEVGVAELHRVHQLVEEAADRDAPAAGVRRGRPAAVRGQVELDVVAPGGLAHDGVGGHVALAEVDLVLERRRWPSAASPARAPGPRPTGSAGSATSCRADAGCRTPRSRRCRGCRRCGGSSSSAGWA